MIMFAIEWAIYPNNPSIHHFINVLLYAISIGILFKFLTKSLPTYSIWIPFIIALIFALHPSHTEVVSNIKSRDENLCFLFFLFTIKSLSLETPSDSMTYIKSEILFFACLLSKEASILILPIIGLYFWMIKREKIVVVVKKTLPLVISALLWLIIQPYLI